jgi:hypothetical protein
VNVDRATERRLNWELIHGGLITIVVVGALMFGVYKLISVWWISAIMLAAGGAFQSFALLEVIDAIVRLTSLPRE